MSRANLLRFGGLAAILAGVLRVVLSLFIVAANRFGGAIEFLSLLTDICILFGVMGLYGVQYEESGVWGFLGFLLIGCGACDSPN